MSSAINNLKSINLNSTSSVEKLEEIYLQTFNNIFSFENNDIEIIGNVEELWFRVKDVLKILGYSENRKSLNEIIRNSIPEKHKKERVGLVGLGQPLPPKNYHKDKEIFINEGGFYRLIMRSNKPNAEPFQDFVQDVLLPNIRKQINKISKSEDNSLRGDLKKIMNQNNTLISQNTLAFQRLDDIQEELHDTNTKLDKALPDRNVNPKDEDLNHYYILFKNKDSSNEYMCIRGQDKYIKNRINFYKNNFDIIIDSRKNPNPIDLMNRLKEKIEKINKSNYSDVIDNFKLSDVYNTLSYTEKRKKIFNLEKENSKILYRSNKIKLLDYLEKTLLELINELDNEKYDV